MQKASAYLAAILLLLEIAFCPTLQAQVDQSVYSDGLDNEWVSYGWATLNFTESGTFHSGNQAISVTCGGYQALYLHHNSFDTSVYTNLVFWINGGPTGGQSLQVQATLQGQAKTPYLLSSLQANTWVKVRVPLSALGAANVYSMDGFWIQSRSSSSIPTFFVDDISLEGVPVGPPPTNNILVDAAANRHAINPMIYGLAYASTADLTDLRCPVNRRGGNNTTRYNWQANADNRASDYYFESIGYSSATPGADADTFVFNSKAGGAQSMITIPTIDWVAKLGPGRSKLASFSIAKYGAQTGHDPYFPDAGTGVLSAGGNVTGNNPSDADVPSDSTFQQGWVQHLVNTWGYATNAGVRYYLLDNEPSLWQATHRDVHPIGPTMEEIRNKTLDFAARIKAVDPQALVVGPEEWGWSGYFYSGYDQQYGSQHGYSSLPDRAAHGNQDYLPWFLDQLRRTNAATGQRLLDIFTVHYYPQGGEFGDDVSTGMQLLRNRSTRSLWDTNYVDSSWINDVVKLIPRIKDWVATYYPGTKTGLTEYNWGAEWHINGGTAQADILGIFGREGLDYAARWTTPTNGAPAYNAIRMYRNYDGNNSGFGDMSVTALATNSDQVSAFAAQRTNDGALTIMVVCKALAGPLPVNLKLTNYVGSGIAQAWHFSGLTNSIKRVQDVPYTNGLLRMLLPAQSVTLFVIPGAPARLEPGPPRSDHQFECWLNGDIGQSYIIQSSIQLKNWASVSTNTMSSSRMHVLLPMNSTPFNFFRAVRSP